VSGTIPNVAVVGGVGPGSPAVAGPPPAGGGVPVHGPSFADMLARSAGAMPTQAPTFSRHAMERVQRRGIALDPSTLARLAGGMSRAATKGSRAAVVFVDNTAFVVSVPNNTVVTAVGSEHMREHVFTNVDSAVIA
jgi:flagellar operon protein